MTDILATSPILLSGMNLPGESAASMARRRGHFIGADVTPGMSDDEILDAPLSVINEILAAGNYTIINPVRVATTASIARTGLPVVDGVQLVDGDRVLDKNAATAADRGIYVAASGAWARATDFDTSAEVVTGAYVPVEGGSQAGSWVLTTTGTITVGTTAQTWRVFSYRSAAKLVTSEGIKAPYLGTMLKRRSSVSILEEISPGDQLAPDLEDPTVGMQAAIARAAARGQVVEFDKDARFDDVLPAGAYDFPENVGLAMTGGGYMRGAYGVYFNFAEGTPEIASESGGFIHGPQLNFVGGTPRVQNLRWIGWGLEGANTAAIFMGGTDGATYTNAVFENIDFTNGKYGFARSGLNSTAKNTQVRNIRASSMLSDVVLFDVIRNDFNTIVDGVTLADVDSGPLVGLVTNWGIGVSFSGYAPPGDTLQPGQFFEINNVIGSTLAQLVHVEYCQKFSLSGIIGNDIRDSVDNPYPGSGIEPALLALYQCTDFTASNIRGYGDAANVYLFPGNGELPCENFTLENVDVEQGVAIVLGRGGFCVVRNIRTGTPMVIHQRCSHMFFDNIMGRGGAVSGGSPQALQFNFDGTGGFPDNRPTTPCLLRMGGDISGFGTDFSRSASYVFPSDQTKMIVDPGQVLRGLQAASAPSLTGYPAGAVIPNSAIAAGGNTGWLHAGSGVWKAYGAIPS